MNILYEDKYMLICEKPANLLSEPDGSGNDVISTIRRECGEDVLLVHRLDRNTGGVMVFAKNTVAASKISALIQNKSFTKEYLAIVHGVPQEVQGIYKDLLFKDSRKNKSYIVSRMRKGVKEASLEYCVLEKVTNDDNPFSALRVKLHTGRTHQIRVQFASRKMPLLGDGKYGSKDNNCNTALWSYHIAFKHPFKGNDISVFCTPPDTYPWNRFEKIYNLKD